MNLDTNINQESCEVCFKIVCNGCKWEPSSEQVVQIQSGVLTSCPLCGWKPQQK